MSAATHTTADQHAEEIRPFLLTAYLGHPDDQALYALEALRVRAAAADTLADTLREIEHYPFDVMASPETDLARVKDIAAAALAAYDAARNNT